LVVLALLGGLLLLACIKFCPTQRQKDAAMAALWGVQEGELVPDAEQMTRCAQLFGLTFPKSTRPIKMRYLLWQDDAIWLKLEIAKEDISALIAASPFAGDELSETEDRMWAVQDLNWWDPETVKTFRCGETQLPDLSYLRILIDTGKKDVAVVYLKWFQT